MEMPKKLEQLNFEYNKSLSKYNTWGTEAKAEIFLEAKSQNDIKHAVKWARDNNHSITILGKGANVLLPDEGINGLVIINKSSEIKFLDKVKKDQKFDNSKPLHEEKDQKMYTVADLDFEEKGERKMVKFDSGVDLTLAIIKTLKNNLSGLQWFAGIPSTMGGAMYNNIHGGKKHLSEYFVKAEILDTQTGEVFEAEKDFFEFGYDKSILREKPHLIVLSVTLGLFESDPEQISKADYAFREWTKRKKDQPRKSAGCVFKNFSNDDKEKNNFTTCSVGYLVDQLGLKGTVCGGAKISEYHGNFIENVGGATSKDIKDLIDLIKKQAMAKYNIKLEEEIKRF